MHFSPDSSVRPDIFTPIDLSFQDTYVCMTCAGLPTTTQLCSQYTARRNRAMRNQTAAFLLNLVVPLLLTGALSEIAVGQVLYKVTDVGTLAPAGQTTAVAINNNGQVLGTSSGCPPIVPPPLGTSA